MQRNSREVRIMSMSRLLSIALLLFVSAAHAALPGTTRKVVFHQVGPNYRLTTVTAPVPKPGAGQVLVHMHVVALNRGNVENLANASGKLEGMTTASDGAGEVVALGVGAREFRIGDRVTSMYWHDYTDSPPNARSFTGALGSSI